MIDVFSLGPLLGWVRKMGNGSDFTPRDATPMFRLGHMARFVILPSNLVQCDLFYGLFLLVIEEKEGFKREVEQRNARHLSTVSTSIFHYSAFRVPQRIKIMDRFVIIPLGGCGARFREADITMPKALIEVRGKPILFWLIDSLLEHEGEAVASLRGICVPYHREYDAVVGSSNGFADLLHRRYSGVVSVFAFPLEQDTCGAAETVLSGLEHIRTCALSSETLPTFATLCVDADNFYTSGDIIRRWNGTNCVFSFRDTLPDAKFSYVRIDERHVITEIREKKKISDWANCGAYGFESSVALRDACERCLEQRENGTEAYISSAIREMMTIKGSSFVMHEVRNRDYFCLGTPEDAASFQRAYLLDLDGTLVDTDDTYMCIWQSILRQHGRQYNSHNMSQVFGEFIRGNDDRAVVTKLIDASCPQSVADEISRCKDDAFVRAIETTQVSDIVFPGVFDFLQRIKNSRIAVVTNANRRSAEVILKRSAIDAYVNVLVTADDVQHGKPDPEPYTRAMRLLHTAPRRCVAVEDSSSGYLSASRAHVPVIYAHDASDSGSGPGSLSRTRFRRYDELQLPVRSDADEIRDGHCIFDPIGAVHKCLTDVPCCDVRSNRDDTLQSGYICHVMAATVVTRCRRQRRVVLKMSNHDNALSRVATRLNLYKTELEFYRTMSRSVSWHMRVPEFLGSYECDEGEQIAMVLADVRRTNGQFDVDLSTDAECLLRVVQDAHALHGSMRFVQELDIPMHMKWLKTMTQKNEYATIVEERFVDFMRAAEAAALSSDMIDVLRAIKERFRTILGHLSTFPLSVCHGDFKSPNMYYSHRSSDLSITYLDWQYVHLNKGVSDIAFLLVESIAFDADVTEGVLRHYVQLSRDVDPSCTLESVRFDFVCALCAFPFFVMVWFNSESKSVLPDPEFPSRFMRNLTKYYAHYVTHDFLSKL